MNPLSDGRQWIVITGDNREILPTLDQVDHVITDPPYDDTTHSNAKTSRKGCDDGVLEIGFEPLSDFSFVCDLLRLSRQWVVCFCAMEQLGEYKRASQDAWVRSGFWDRRAGTAFARSDRPYQPGEGIAIMSDADEKVFPAGAKRAIWASTIARDDREHETQKPLPLMLEIISDFTRPGDVVLDPFGGSMTTGVACVRLGRKFIGIERNPKHANFGRERIEAESRLSTLSALRSGQEALFR